MKLAFALCATIGLGFCIAAAAQAATIAVGNFYLLANTPNQTIQISVSGGGQVSGLNLDVQIGDGGPELASYGVPAGTAGPTITAVDLKGIGGNPATIFSSIADSQTNLMSIPQVSFSSIAITSPDGTVSASGTLANLTINTTGFTTGGQSFNLLLSNVLPFSSLGGPYATDFAGTPASIANGSIIIATTPGAAYWQGCVDSVWSTDTFTNTGTNWTTDATGATNTHAPPGASSDVFFTTTGRGSHLSTTLGADTSIKGLTFTSAATNAASIGGGNTLTLGGDGLTVQVGAASPTIGAAVSLGTSQTWTINGSNPLMVSGPMGFGGFTLDKAGTAPLLLSGAQTFGGSAAINVDAGVLRFNVSAPSTVGTNVTATVAGGATLELAGNVPALGTTAGIATRNLVNVANNSTVSAGGLHVSGTNQLAGTITGVGNTVVDAGGRLRAYQIRQNSLTIGSGATVALVPSGSTSTPALPNNINFSSSLASLSIASSGGVYTGTLDIGNNGLVIAYGSTADPYAAIDAMIESGYNGGVWGGKGITSSLAQAGVAQNISTPLNIGLVDFTPGTGNDTNTTFIVFSGQTVTTNAILLRLTYMDDVVLAGDMNQNNSTSDALLFAANFGTGTTWGVGDLTHDSMIDSNDALLFAANFQVGLPSLDGSTGNAAALAGSAAAVPEPSSLAITILAALGLAILSPRFSSSAR